VCSRNILACLSITLVCSLGGLAVSKASRAQTLSEAEILGFEQWLHSLEKSITGRAKVDQPENNPLFPFGIPRTEVTTDTPFRKLTISRALGDLEADLVRAGTWRKRGAFGAMAMARNYRNLTEYENALLWYQRAAELDTGGAYASDISSETLATAIALDDSLRIAHNLINTLGASDPKQREDEIVLTFRRLLGERDDRNLALLVQKVMRLDHSMSSRVRYWQAFAQAHLAQHTAAREELSKLVSGGGLSHGLSEQQRAWVLVALPDLLVQENRHTDAEHLYRLLAESDLEPLRSWGFFQLGNLNLLAGHFLKAHTTFTRLCESQTTSTWRQEACDLASLAEQLSQIKLEAEPYGAAARYE
jgi:hypothetical protein